MAFSNKKQGRKYVPGVLWVFLFIHWNLFLSDHKESFVRCWNPNMNKQQSLTLSFLFSTKVTKPKNSQWFQVARKTSQEAYWWWGKDHKWTSEEGKGILERARMGFEMRDMGAWMWVLSFTAFVTLGKFLSLLLWVSVSSIINRLLWGSNKKQNTACYSDWHMADT